jgi:hypothetical protein
MADLNDLTQNVNIWNDDKSKSVTVTTDGAKERLDVAASIEGGSFQLQPFIPLFDFSVADIALNTSTDTSLFSESGHAGKIDFISIAGSISTWEVVIKVDTVEILRIPMSQLGSDLGLSNATNVPLWVETANKNFRFSPDEGVDFTDNFEVLAKAITGSPTVNWLVNHRDAQ